MTKQLPKRPRYTCANCGNEYTKFYFNAYHGPRCTLKKSKHGIFKRQRPKVTTTSTCEHCGRTTQSGWYFNTTHGDKCRYRPGGPAEMEEKQKNGVDNDVVKLTYREYIRILKTMKDDQRAKLNGWNVAR